MLLLVDVPLMVNPAGTCQNQLGLKMNILIGGLMAVLHLLGSTDKEL